MLITDLAWAALGWVLMGVILVGLPGGLCVYLGPGAALAYDLCLGLVVGFLARKFCKSFDSLDDKGDTLKPGNCSRGF